MSDKSYSLRSHQALQPAFEAIEKSVNSAEDALARMIAVDTTFPPGEGYGAFADLAQSLFETLSFGFERVSVPEGLWKTRSGKASGERINLIGERVTGKPVCGLYFHVDTVPVAPGWTFEPFAMTKMDDRLYGLGAADMKGTMAACYLALKVAKEHAVPLAYDPMLLFCTDEESGLYPGIRYLAEQGYLKGHILNFNGSAAPRVWAGCFGVFALTLTIRGVPVHAGDGNRSGAGANAIEASIPLLNALMALKEKVGERASKLAPAPGASGPLRPQLYIAAANGGTAPGQVPGRFELLIGRRYAPEESYADARAEIEACIHAALDDLDMITYCIEQTSHLTPTADPDGAHWPRWQKALSAGFGYRKKDFAKWGAASCSDFGYVQQAGVMQEILLGGLGRPSSNVHGPDEHTTSPDIIALAKSVLSYLAADFEPDMIPDQK
nr:M20/M25/M40 family metallo-hydrolase [uncultured Cohaesibacter sp.]